MLLPKKIHHVYPTGNLKNRKERIKSKNSDLNSIIFPRGRRDLNHALDLEEELRKEKLLMREKNMQKP